MKVSGPTWFPDWSGQVCAIVAGGPSVQDDDVAALRDRIRVLVINNSFKLAPWADVLYAADRRWWDVIGRGANFEGLRVTPDRDVAKRLGIELISLVDDSSDAGVNGLSEVAGTLARGGHSGHQALNLAVQFGATRIALLGYDFEGEHWHGRHESPLRNPKLDTMQKWAVRIDALAPALAERGVQVVNCSPIGRLNAYPRMTIAEMLECWA